jgi:hypothetical protein
MNRRRETVPPIAESGMKAADQLLMNYYVERFEGYDSQRGRA